MAPLVAARSGAVRAEEGPPAVRLLPSNVAASISAQLTARQPARRGQRSSPATATCRRQARAFISHGRDVVCELHHSKACEDHRAAGAPAENRPRRRTVTTAAYRRRGARAGAGRNRGGALASCQGTAAAPSANGAERARPRGLSAAAVPTTRRSAGGRGRAGCARVGLHGRHQLPRASFRRPPARPLSCCPTRDRLALPSTRAAAAALVRQRRLAPGRCRVADAAVSPRSAPQRARALRVATLVSTRPDVAHGRVAAGEPHPQRAEQPDTPRPEVRGTHDDSNAHPS